MGSRGQYKMNTIAERTGFTPAVLRAWERRHALLDPERTEGGHRLYTDDDLRVLERVRVLLDAGRSIGEIASQGRGALLASGRREAVGEAPSHAALAELQRWCAQIVEAAVALDDARLERALDEAFALVSPPAVIAAVVEPALRAIGELWAAGRCTVAGEHLASARILSRLLKLVEASNPAGGNGARPAVCACLPDEQHELGALVTAYALTRHNYRVAYLGASMPLPDLERTCQVLSPELVCLSVSRPALLELHEPQLTAMLGRLRGVRLLVGGQGVNGGDHTALERAGARLIRGAESLEDALRDPRTVARRRR